MTMTIEELVQKVSTVYREERRKVYDLRVELRSVLNSLAEADHTCGRNITLADYNALIRRKDELIEQIGMKTQYYEGISYVRELLMNLGFDTEIKM